MSTTTSRKDCRDNSAAASATRKSQKFSLNGNFVHSNFMGTGDRIALEINAGKYSKSYTFAHTDPYTTIDGVARTTSLTYRDITQFVAASSAFSTKQITGAVQWSYPITEYQYLQVGRLRQQEQLGGLAGVQRAAGGRLGASTTAIPSSATSTDTNGDGVVNSLDSPYTVYGTNFYTYELTGGWNLRCAQPRAVRRPRHASGDLGAATRCR